MLGLAPPLTRSRGLHYCIKYKKMASHNKTFIKSKIWKMHHAYCQIDHFLVNFSFSFIFLFESNKKRNVDKFLLQKLPPYLLLYHAGLPANGRSLSLPLKISEFCQIYLTSISMYCLYSPNILIVTKYQNFTKYIWIRQICIVVWYNKLFKSRSHRHGICPKIYTAGFSG